MREAFLVLLLVVGIVGCRSEIGESEDIDTLTAMADGSVVACLHRSREYQNGLADCCENTVDYATIRLDASGRRDDGNDARPCPPYDLIAAVRRTDGQILLPDGSALLIHQESRGEQCDVSSIDAAGTTRWTETFRFFMFPATTEPVGDFVFLGNSTTLVKLDWRSGSVVRTVTLHAF